MCCLDKLQEKVHQYKEKQESLRFFVYEQKKRSNQEQNEKDFYEALYSQPFYHLAGWVFKIAKEQCAGKY